MLDQTKIDHLRASVAELKSVAVAFSAGVDSTLLLAVALDVLGPENVLAITADSPTLPRSELAEAQSLASELGASLTLVSTDEMDNPDFVANGPDRCYHCKKELFAQMRDLANEAGYQHLIYGATAEDVGDYRPGMEAAKQAGAIAPLLDAGLCKQDVRDLSRQMGLRTWNKPAMACLSSRFAYGTAIEVEGLSRVEQAEEWLRHTLGLRQLRVRDEGTTARIEVEPADLPRLVKEDIRSQVIARLKEIGYTYITLNLEGFRSGSLNDVLARNEKDSAPRVREDA